MPDLARLTVVAVAYPTCSDAVGATSGFTQATASGGASARVGARGDSMTSRDASSRTTVMGHLRQTRSINQSAPARAGVMMYVTPPRYRCSHRAAGLFDVLGRGGDADVDVSADSASRSLRRRLVDLEMLQPSRLDVPAGLVDALDEVGMSRRHEPHLRARRSAVIRRPSPVFCISRIQRQPTAVRTPPASQVPPSATGLRDGGRRSRGRRITPTTRTSRCNQRATATPGSTER